jgi:glycosyltransferase involved in cell wall biosynthesis
MPVLELVQTLSLGGLEKMVCTLAQALSQDKRFKVLVATYDNLEGQPSFVSQFEETGIPLVKWQKGTGFSVRTVVRLVQIIFSEKTRILHVHNLGPLIYGSLAKVFSLGRVRLVLTVHTLVHIQQSPRYELYFKFFLRFADRIIAVSPGVQSGLLALGVRPERVDVIPNGATFSSAPTTRVDEKRALKKQIMPRLPPYLYDLRWILYLARFEPRKGQDVALDVWDALPREARAELALFFVGEETKAGYVDSLRQRIGCLADAEHVILAGPSEHSGRWVQASDLFMSCALYEGMPLSPLEAAGSGLPAILSEIDGHRFLMPWAGLFAPGRPEEGAKRILDILRAMKNDGDARFFENRWSAAAPLRQKWSVPVMAATYAEVFQSTFA